MAYVIVQHLDPYHASRLPSLLGRATQMPVVELSQRTRPQPDTVYVQPPNKCVICKNGDLTLIRRVERMSLAIDHFFESLAEEQGRRAIGVLLSGSGSDGTAGLRAIKAATGFTFAQDEESAKFPSMPRNAIASGFVDAALSPKEIAAELRRIAGHPYIKKAVPEKEEQEPHIDLDDLSRIFLELRKHTGVDFTAYKQTTLQRRMERRMASHRIERLSQRKGRGKRKTGMREELSATKESLQAIIEEQEATNEELKSANEEIESSNEELQSTNEELETTKEELQSTNEELATLNEELSNRNLEIMQINSDLNNLLSSVHLPIVMVDNGLTLRRATPTARDVFNIVDSDIGRRISELRPNVAVPEFEKLLRDVIDTLSIREREVRDKQGRRYSLRIRPYRRADNKIDGAVITMVDIHERRDRHCA